MRMLCVACNFPFVVRRRDEKKTPSVTRHHAWNWNTIVRANNLWFFYMEEGIRAAFLSGNFAAAPETFTGRGIFNLIARRTSL